jgi:hypothetical protein
LLIVSLIYFNIVGIITASHLLEPNQTKNKQTDARPKERQNKERLMRQGGTEREETCYVHAGGQGRGLLRAEDSFLALNKNHSTL